jgi:Mn-dependent transcriptional regulator
MEDYLRAVYELQRRDGGSVATSSVAEALDVTPPTATSMLGTLADRGLLDREKYRGVELTPEGETVALEIIRHHRLIETYLAERLGYDWTEVHDEADSLEHHISEAFERRVADQLDDPDVDPHGDPIPADTLDPVSGVEGTTLAARDEGEAVVVRRVQDDDPNELAYLEASGITPGTQILVEEVAPIGVMTVVPADDEPVAIPDGIAEVIWVDAVETQSWTEPNGLA